MPEISIPNLDCMSSDELITFNERHRNSPHAAMRLAARYAEAKARAVRDRLSGHITSALDNEAFADKVYRLIPKRHRW